MSAEERAARLRDIQDRVLARSRYRQRIRLVAVGAAVVVGLMHILGGASDANTVISLLLIIVVLLGAQL